MLTAAVLAVTGARANAYSLEPHFLDRGDEAILVAPRANFRLELERLGFGPSKTEPTDDTNSDYAGEAAGGETADLAAALKKAKVSLTKAGSIRNAHAAMRHALSAFRRASEAWQEQCRGLDAPGTDQPAAAKPKPPSRPALTFPEGLPAEFADYLEGAIAWYDAGTADKSTARAAWERLLARLPDQRHWKSTWGAFMLGKSWQDDEPEKAIGYFQQVRSLARRGFTDSIGLSAASLGLEARVRLRQEQFEKAIELYLEQFAAGDDSAFRSIAISVGAALRSGDLPRLASNPRVQQVVTAYLISSEFRRLRDSVSDVDPEALAAEQGWLRATVSAQVKDRDSAEKLAWIAYRCNELAELKHWLHLCGRSPVAQWIEAKLLLRECKLDEAERMLIRCQPGFPTSARTNDPPPSSLAENLFVCHWWGNTPAAEEILGELGVARLARGEYAAALDSFLRAGAWMDAAYLAERVLTLDELKNYVDESWPHVSEQQVQEEKEKFGESPIAPYMLREQIRYLLARRLTRSFRGDVAREYYPALLVNQFDFLAQALRIGWDDSIPTNDRATAFIQAAFITRTNGMELLATELGPDWHIHGGGNEDGVSWQDRATNYLDSKIVRARPEEIRRASQHNADPERRFHYRYQAALLAWEAAKLMPNESDETARILCVAGSWLKDRDPETADILYKALVRRNRKTALGARADLRRWFPDIDEDGNLIVQTDVLRSPDAADAAQEEAAANSDEMEASADQEIENFISDVSKVVEQGEDTQNDEPIGTTVHVIEPGDSLAKIAAMYAVSVEDLLMSNPGLNPVALRVGARIVVPTQTPNASTTDTARLEYEVQPGDTILGIARRYSNAGAFLTIDQILSANPGLQPRRIVGGQRIIIPAD